MSQCTVQVLVSDGWPARTCDSAKRGAALSKTHVIRFYTGSRHQAKSLVATFGTHEQLSPGAAVLYYRILLVMDLLYP